MSDRSLGTEAARLPTEVARLRDEINVCFAYLRDECGVDGGLTLYEAIEVLARSRNRLIAEVERLEALNSAQNQTPSAKEK